MKNARVLFLSIAVWDFYKSRPQELPLALKEYYDYDIIYVEPVVYKQATSLRLQRCSSHSTKGISVIQRSVSWRKNPLLLLYQNWSNVRQIKKHKPDAVIASDHLMSVCAAIYCKLTGRKFIFDHIDHWIEVEKERFVKWYLRYIAYPVYGLCSHALFHTTSYLSSLMKQFKKKSIVLPNAKSEQDITLFSSYAEAPKQEIHFVGTLRDWYDFDLLFAVMKQLSDLQLHIYGQGEMREFIQQQSQQLQNVFLHDPVNYDELPAVIQRSLIGVVPLKQIPLNNGTLPIKLFDYWAAKKAVVATPTRELEQVGGEACVFAKTIEEWVAAIQQLVHDQELREQKEQESFLLMKRKYNYRAIAERCHEILCQ